MTEELKQAAQAALEALKNVTDYDQINAARRALERALTQRPAAQTEREAFEAWMIEVEGARIRSRFDRVTAGPFEGDYRDGQIQGAWNVWQARASLPAPQQATPDQFADASKMVSPVALRSVRLTRDTAGMCVVRVNGRVAIRDNGDIIDHTATLEWFADTQQATPEPVAWSYELAHCFHTDGNFSDWRPHITRHEPNVPAGSIRSLRPLVYGDTRPAPGVPEDSALLDYLDTLAARPAGSDLHCFGGRVVLYVRTGIGSQIEASGAGTAREAIRAALAAAQAKGGH